jgi:hypothetical protein
MTAALPPAALPSTPVGMWCVAVTPELAASWLYPRINRQTYHTLVDMYADRMRAGLWHRRRENPVEIVDGKAVEGGHRLNAVIKCGLTVDMWVLFR